MLPPSAARFSAGKYGAAMRVAVIASGTGSILQSMIDHQLPIQLVLVDRQCGAIDIAASAGIVTAVVERTDYSASFDREAHTAAVIKELQAHSIDLIAMAGYGTILGPAMFSAFEGRVINTHPALLPNFKGWHAVRDALAAQATVTGCTVHVATAAVDDGPILAQVEVPVVPGDTEGSLHERIKLVERELYPQVIADIIQRGSVLPAIANAPTGGTP